MKKTALVFLLIFLAISSIGLRKYIAHYFPNMTAQELQFFLVSLQFGGANGASPTLVRYFILRCLINPLIYASIIIIVYQCLKYIYNSFIYRYISPFLNSRFKTIVKKINGILVLTCLALFIIVCNLHSTLAMIDFVPKPYSNFYEEYYTHSSKDIVNFKGKKKNLIIIQVESLEKTFGDKEFFGQSLIPYLEKLEKEGIQFDNYINGFAASYTAGALIASLTGTPVTHISGTVINRAGKDISILKSVYSLGDILTDNGYSSYSFYNGNLDFGGARHFFVLHGMKEENMIDKNNLTQYLPTAKKQHGWGYGDEDIFKVIKKKIEEINNKQPYFLHIQTVDSHFGVIPKNIKYKKFGNVYKDTIYNTNIFVSNFIDWFKQRPEYNNTVIIIFGDHLRMADALSMPKERRIYNLFLNTDFSADVNTQRTFSQIDLFPTILEAMGATVEGHRLGLGTSVFSEEKTLLERFSAEFIDGELSKRNKVYEKLWL